MRHFYATDTDVREVLDNCNTPPSFCDKKLVIVDNVEAWDAADSKLLWAYLEKPADFTCLALLSTENKLNKTPEGTVVFYPLYEDEMRNWIAGRVRGLGKSITPQAAGKLMALCNGLLTEVNDEIGKLILYTREKKEIALKDVEDLTADTKQYTVFELIDALIARDLKRSLKISARLYDSCEEPRKPGRKKGKSKEPLPEEKAAEGKKVRESSGGKDGKLYGFFVMLSRNIQDVFFLKYLLEKERRRPEEIRSGMGIRSDYRFNKMMGQARSGRLDRYEKVIHALFRFDRQFKGMAGPVGSREALFQDLIFRLCAVPQTRS